MDELGVCKQRIRQILGALPCGYIYGEVVVNGNGDSEDYTVLDVNHAFSDITATTREKVLGSRIAGLFSLSSVKDDIAIFSAVAITGDPVEKEFYSPHFGNHFRLFCFSPEQGFFIALLTDLSQEKKLENRLDFVWQFGNSTSDEFFILAPSGKFVLGNNAVATKLGTNLVGIPGHKLSDLNPIADGEWWETLWNSLLQRGSLQFETDHKGKDNVVYPVELSVDLMEFDGRKYASFVAKNVSAKQIISKALRQDRRFAEHAASMAGYFVWMIDSLGVFRPLLGGNGNLVAGPVDDVFFSSIHHDDRNLLAKAIQAEAEGTRDLRLKTERGAVYHRFKWSRVEDNCIVGISYPVGGTGLAGIGSHSIAMDALTLMAESVLVRVNKLEIALNQNNIGVATRMVQALTANFASISGKNNFPEKIRLDAYLTEKEGMLKQLIEPEISLILDVSTRSVGLIDPSSLENILVRLFLAIQSTELVTGISMRSFTDTLNAGLFVTVSGKDGIQAALESAFIPVKSQVPGLASVYAMVRAGGGRVYYETLDDQVQFTLNFPKAGLDDDSAFILVALPDSVDAARTSAALRSAGFSVAVENSFSEILRRISEEEVGLLIVSTFMSDFSLEDIRSKISGVSLIQIGGKPADNHTKYLPHDFRTNDLVAMVNEITSATTETLQAIDLPGGNLWGEPHLMPPLS